MSTPEFPGGPLGDVAQAQLAHEIERMAREVFTGVGPAPYAANETPFGVGRGSAVGGTRDVGAGGYAPGAERAPVEPPGNPWSVPLVDAPTHGEKSGSDHLYFVQLPTNERGEEVEPRLAPPKSAYPTAHDYSYSPHVGPHEVRPKESPPGIFDAHAVKRDFPILHQRVNNRPLVWLDNAATTQKPQCVIDRLAHFYAHENSNVHRAAHTLAARATDAYEGARKEVQRFVNAGSSDEIVWVRGTTEGINLIANTYGERNVESGDEVVITHLEHHANIVPWQMLCQRKHAKLRVAPVDSRGQVILEEFERLLSSRTRIVAIPQVSNALGTIVPVQAMIEMAHRRGARVLVDGAQSVSHMPVDVQALDCDFFVFSGHKIFGPTGIGAVYGKKELLAAMPPWQGGGNMIADVTFEKTSYQAPPWRFEAGTGNIADAVGLGAALEYVTRLGLPNIARHEHDLRVYAEEQLVTIPGLTLVGTAPDKAGVISFVLDGQKTEEVGNLLDMEGIAVRSGHHCAQPILRRFGLEASVRASLAPYNTKEDIDALVAAVRRLQGQRAGLRR